MLTGEAAKTFHEMLFNNLAMDLYWGHGTQWHNSWGKNSDIKCFRQTRKPFLISKLMLFMTKSVCIRFDKNIINADSSVKSSSLLEHS